MKATTITAKHKSKCPGCSQTVFPGSLTQVYNNEWYHTTCWDELWSKIVKEKESKKASNGDAYINMEVKRDETAHELRGLVLQMEVLIGRIREISREMGAEW